MKNKILLDGNLIHSMEIKDLNIFSAKVTIEQNKIGSFKFVIYPSNPYYSKINKLKSIVKVYQNNTMIFNGRVVETTTKTNKSIDVYCESDEAYLCDTLHEPFEYSGSVRGLLETFIESHNSQVGDDKKFVIGNVTVTDPNDYIVRSSEEYDTTWNRIQDKLIKLLGGYLVIRHEEDGNYIDYLEDFDTLNSQHVVFGKNMLSVKVDDDYSNIATRLIPLGAKDDETKKRLTIESVNDGKIYIENEEAIAKYGRITKYATWEDVTIPANLLRKGKEYLDTAIKPSNVIEISALDMAIVNQDISNFKMYSKIKVTSQYHGFDEYFTPLKMTIDLFNQANNKITLNGENVTITGGSSSAQIAKIESQISKIEGSTSSNTEITYALAQQLKSELSQSINAIVSEIKEELLYNDNLINEQSTSLTQTKEYFEMLFSTFNQNLIDVVNGTNASFEDIKKYIRFEDGNIILGQIDNEFTLKISNEKISLMQGGYEVAYLSNSKLYVTYANILNSLQIGNFAFVPRSSGNLSFKKVGNLWL